MPPSFGVLIPLCKAKIDNIDNVLIFATSNQEIVRFDISVQETVLMDKFYSLEL